MSLRIAFFADAHLGYKAKVRSNSQGINIRQQDGYDAFREVVAGIVKHNEIEPIDAVVIAGDLFHVSKPSIRDITVAQHYVRELAKRGIKVIILAGNHDANDIRSELAAVAPLTDLDKNIHAFINPYTQHEIVDGVMLHIVSHHGLSGDDVPDVEPVSGVYNIFTTHGAALDPKNQALMRCADSPREQFIPVEMIVDDNFVAKLLGHYHSRYAVGGEALNSWYSGSLVRRGFSDAPGPRGWILFELSSHGETKFTPIDIKQRSQFDFDPIDATGLTASDVMDLVVENIERTTETGDAPIARQQVINATRGIKEGIDTAKIEELTKHMLDWRLEYPKNQQNLSAAENKSIKDMSISNKQSVNILSTYKDWIKEVSKDVPEEYREIVVKDAEHYIKTARDRNFDNNS